jgi:hypothetical protein
MLGKKRRQFFVDATLQGALLTRCVFYWGMCLAAVFVSLLCWDAVVGPSQIFASRVETTWFKYAPAILFVAALTPIMAFDFLRLSNRFAGPMIRLRRAMRDLGQGERVEPVVLRRNDFWRDFSDEFNSVVLRIRKLEADLAAARQEAVADLETDAELSEIESPAVPSDSDMIAAR